MSLKKDFATALLGLTLALQKPREEEMRKPANAPQKQAIAPKNPA